MSPEPISYPNAFPAGQENWEMVYAFPGLICLTPKSAAVFGALAHVVVLEGGSVRALKLISPGPSMLKDEVCNSSSVGKRKIRLQVFPASPPAMSNVKRLDIALGVI